MKGAIYVLILILLAAASAIAFASASVENPSIDNLWPDGPHVMVSSANTKSLEDKFAQSLQALKVQRGLDSQNRSDASGAAAPLAGSKEKALNNSSSNAVMLDSSNSSGIASGMNNSSVANSEAALLSNGSDRHKVGVGSVGSFQGFYGLTASRHEMGKSDIKSRMFLSGDFDVDKTVSFSDRGV